MSLSYEKLFILMKEKGLTTYRIRKENIISQSALSALKNGKSVTTETIEKLCRALGCQPGDIMSYIDDKQEIFFDDKK
ncbi:helix-turn-helix transcriptional regulator [Ruminococcus sp.]|jgi:putative transcriptional regulator|uniref:helix-turn-helix domain-containing protein n=1 Tax=Ruminococcus TaxID=1263 RepID=UPI0025EA3741|nr:helix-turn-helix transcriptional regulator [Ruminococcus sp.]MBD9050289.1 XRE family transcriptional regulator [Ruminococcus sp.]MBD9051477.1 XRE family transcriptional regulator [Ruminococcus sp.]